MSWRKKIEDTKTLSIANRYGSIINISVPAGELDSFTIYASDNRSFEGTTIADSFQYILIPEGCVLHSFRCSPVTNTSNENYGKHTVMVSLYNPTDEDITGTISYGVNSIIQYN